MTKLDYPPLFVAMAFRKEFQYRDSDFKKFICNDLATSCKNLVNFDPVTPEFKKGNYVHPVVENKPFRQIISRFTGPIFTTFSPYCRYFIVDYRLDPLMGSLNGCCHGNQFYS